LGKNKEKVKEKPFLVLALKINELMKYEKTADSVKPILKITSKR
jgi:hypothetical protein